MKLFVDTWGWLTLADRQERRDAAVARLYRERIQADGGVVTSFFVLDETITLRYRRLDLSRAWQIVSRLLRSPAILAEAVTPERFYRAVELRRRFGDKPEISFTDLTSLAIMKELGLRDVLTEDQDFVRAGLGYRLLPE